MSDVCRIEIRCNDMDRLEEEIKTFLDLAKKTYKEQLSKLNKVSFVKLPSELYNEYIRAEDHIDIYIPTPIPVKFLAKRFLNKMKKNIEGYLKAKNLKVKAKVIC